MRQPLGRAHHVGAARVRRQRGVLAAEHEVAAHAGGQVDDDVDVRGADPLDDLAVVREVARAPAGLRVADVDVDDRCARARRLDRRVGDLLRGDRHVLAPAGRVAGAGDRAGDEDVPVHETVVRDVNGRCTWRDGASLGGVRAAPSRRLDRRTGADLGCAMLAGGS